MKKQCFIYGIIFILLALILEFIMLYVNSDHFLSTILMLGGALFIISGITGKAPFTGKELKPVETKPKKQYNLKGAICYEFWYFSFINCFIIIRVVSI